MRGKDLRQLQIQHYTLLDRLLPAMQSFISQTEGTMRQQQDVLNLLRQVKSDHLAAVDYIDVAIAALEGRGRLAVAQPGEEDEEMIRLATPRQKPSAPKVKDTPERRRRSQIAKKAPPRFRGLLKPSVMAVVTAPGFKAAESIDALVKDAQRHAKEEFHRRVPAKNMRQMVHTMIYEGILCRDGNTGVVTLCTDK